MQVEEREFENQYIGPQSGATKAVILPFDKIPWWAKDWGSVAQIEDKLTYSIGGTVNSFKRVK